MISPTLGLGLAFEKRTCRARNRTGAATAEGQIVQFDHDFGSEANTRQTNDALSIYANVVAPESARAGFGLFAVCQEVKADNAWLTVLVSGQTRALIDGTAAVGSLGTPVGGTSGRLDVASQTATHKAVAIIEEAGVDGDLVAVLFNGITGVGVP